MSKTEQGWEKWNSDEKVFFNGLHDDGDYYENDDGSGTYYRADGSVGYINADGSGTYYGVDGSVGYKDSDGSGTYYRSDGGVAYRNADGSSTYYGNNGDVGYKNSDGSSTYYGQNDEEDDEDERGEEHELEYDDYEDDTEETSKDYNGGIILGLGLAVYAMLKSRHGYYNSSHEESGEDEEGEEDADYERDDSYNSSESAYSTTRSYSQRSFRDAWQDFLHGIKIIFITISVIAGVALIAFIAYKIDGSVNGIEIGFDSTNIDYQDKDDVVRQLRDKGFLWVSYSGVEDLDFSDAQNENLVKTIIVDNSDSFKKEDTFSRFTKITVQYHQVKYSEVPFSSKDAKDLTYEEVISELRKAGFGNIETEVDYDIVVGWFDDSGDIEFVSIDGNKKYDLGYYKRVDVPIIVKYHDLKKNRP